MGNVFPGADNQIIGLLLATVPFVIGLAYLLRGARKRPNFGTWVKKENGDLVLRAAEHPEQLFVFPEGEHTLAQAWNGAVAKYPNNKCFGTRELVAVDEIEEKGRKFEKLTLGEYKWKTYAQANEDVQNFAAGLVALGHKSGEVVGILADTSAEWQTSSQACFQRGFPLATAYTSLGVEAAMFAFDESECTTLIVDRKMLRSLKPHNPADKTLSLPARVKRVLYISTAQEEKREGERVSDSNPANQLPGLASWKDVIARGASVAHESAAVAAKKEQTSKVNENSIAVIMYTSGSTGTPKGVLVSHKNLLAVHCAMRLWAKNTDVYLAYLPLAHILEMAAETTCLGMGVALGYGTPLTLTDNSAKIKKGTKGDASALKPTLIAAVPAIMDRIRKTINEKVHEGGGFGKHLFDFAYNWKLRAVQKGHGTPLLDALIFRKTAAVLGGRVRLVLSGGAPLAPETELFMNVCMCCKVGQGYGLTETTGLATCVRTNDFKVGHVGGPIYCAEIKLVDYTEGGYSTKDKPHPRGEIVVGGGHITMGYLKNKEKTDESFKEEGDQRWFYTGDIGEVQADGTLKIIDRKKDLVKLSHGEYIALGKIESVLSKAHFVESVCVYADSYNEYAIAIIVPDRKQTEHELHVSDHFENSPEANKAILESIQKAAAAASLHKSEIPQKVILTSEPWTAETGLVTAALKLRRENIKKAFEKQIAATYKGR